MSLHSSPFQLRASQHTCISWTILEKTLKKREKRKRVLADMQILDHNYGWYIIRCHRLRYTLLTPNELPLVDRKCMWVLSLRWEYNINLIWIIKDKQHAKLLFSGQVGVSLKQSMYPLDQIPTSIAVAYNFIFIF